MKDTVRYFAITAAGMLLLPMTVLLRPSAEAAESEKEIPKKNEYTSFYNIYRTKSETVETVSAQDYLIGAVAAEMPASYEPEALKAQVIASHTYAERICALQRSQPDPALNGADFSDDSSKYQAFYSEDELHTLWGESFSQNYEKITDAVDAVGDIILYYDDEPIVAAFHAVSAGATESAASVWGAGLPYLVSVSSESDITSPQYESTVELTAETVRAALSAVRQGVTFPDDPAAWFRVLSTTDAGTVLSVVGGSEVWTGQQLREALALRSACFAITFEDGVFRITTKGYGHSVGMSQFGANQMALSGSDYREILAHYYPGTELRGT